MEVCLAGVLIYVEVVSGGAEALRLHSQLWKELIVHRGKTPVGF
jgi:hypothetical protein